jgi:cytochrome c oxidase subunit 2
VEQKWWSVLFGVVLFASFALFVVAPFVGWWLPPNLASFGGSIDGLFYVILGFTGFFFVLTEAVLVWAMWRYAARPGEKSTHTHGSHRLELAWTAVPAAILLFIALVQVPAWMEIKYPDRMPDNPAQVIGITAHQWEWRVRYPHKIPEGIRPARVWANRTDRDDMYLPNELHCWKGGDVLIFLQTQDVLHSLFLPNLRLKQDAVPGKIIPVWFRATESNASFADDFDKEKNVWKWQLPEDADGYKKLPAEKDWEIACAELCGGGHYRMRGRLFVHPSKEDYDAWFNHTWAREAGHSLGK